MVIKARQERERGFCSQIGSTELEVAEKKRIGYGDRRRQLFQR